MIIVNDIQKYLVFSENSLAEGLKKISENKSRIVYVVSEQSVLLGSLTDGDVRRWIVSQESIDLNISIYEVMNTTYKSLPHDSSVNEIAALFVNGVDSVPLVDEFDRIKALALQSQEGMSISGREISDTSPSFIIAEIGNNHQGDIGLAKRLVDHAVDAGVDCAKFQMRNMSKLYKNKKGSNDASADLGAQYTMDLLERYQLNNCQLFEIFDYCKEKGILPLCTPWDLESLGVLEKYGMPAYKVASADFTNYELLAAIAKTGKPFFCSTGMSTEQEILDTNKYLSSLSANFILLHCNSTYPTPFKDVNLKYLSRLKKLTGKMVGYSGHERGIEIPIASISLGAVIIEKHLTVDTSLEGADHKVSLLPNELADMVKMIRNVEQGMGDDKRARELTQGEMINRENLAKSLVAVTDITIGQVITRDMVQVKSPGQGLQPNKIDDLIGKISKREIKSGEFFYLSDINGLINKKEQYHFDRPVGVPVRYHDYQKIVEKVNIDFVEFHLSYKDLEEEIDQYFDGEQDIGFAIHCPELFSGDHILDLCSDDLDYKNRSLAELKRVIDVTRKLKKYFPKTKSPVVVLNAGGWDRNGFFDPKNKPNKYSEIASSLRSVNLSGVQIAIQTMPPFPWHFGGQSFHNLFVDADEIANFCREFTDIKICLDISHSMMACNYYGWDLIEFVKKIAPYNVHMHIVDAKGIDGEGVEVGQGDVDFKKLFSVLKEFNPDVQFIPEVWQGHKNSGEGFWKALNFLEQFSLEKI